MSLTERLTDELRRRVLSGQLVPGTVVVEPRLAEEFDVSKTPIRESLRQLTSEGLLQILPKKGYLVRAVTYNDVYETLDLRMLLEPFATAAATRTADAELLDTLRGHLDQQERLAASDPIGSMHAAQRFHELLAKAGGNSRITSTLDKCLADTARAHYVLPGMQQYMSNSQEITEHRRILGAMERGDSDEAQLAMAEHLKSIRAAMLGQHTKSGGLWE